MTHSMYSIRHTTSDIQCLPLV